MAPGSSSPSTPFLELKTYLLTEPTQSRFPAYTQPRTYSRNL
jgi:hypothetical protein